MTDNVNHPKHYEGSCSIECIEAMEIAFGKQAVYDFCKLNAFKYLWRYKHKNGEEDLDKASWYVKRASRYVTDTPESLMSLEKMVLQHKARLMDADNG